MKFSIPRSITLDSMLFGIVAFCIYSFKFILGGIGEAGFRPDDILIAFAFLVLFVRGDIFRTPISKSIKLYCVFVAWGVLSSLWNGFAGRVNPIVSLIFDVRLLQYVVFYFLGYTLTQRGRKFRTLIKVYFLILLIAVPLQMLRILPSVSKFSADRASGNTNGPYELAAVACFLLAYLGYEGESYLGGIGSFILLILTASRVSLLAFLISLCRAGFRMGRRNLLWLVAGTGIAIVIASSLMFVGLYGDSLRDSNIELIRRLGNASSESALDTFVHNYRTSDISKTASDYTLGDFSHVCDYGTCDEAQGDKSANIRYFRWAGLTKSTLANWDSTFIGLGPSFASTAVDGYYVRIFAETGLIGVVLFMLPMLAFRERRAKAQWAFREYVIMLLITGVFIDIFTAYKPMILLWLWHGINQARLDLPELPETGSAAVLGSVPEHLPAPSPATSSSVRLSLP